MNKAVLLQQSILQDVAFLLDDNEAMKKLQAFLQRLKEEKKTKEHVALSDKEVVLGEIRDGFKELKLMKEGKLKGRPVKELLDEL